VANRFSDPRLKEFCPIKLFVRMKPETLDPPSPASVRFFRYGVRNRETQSLSKAFFSNPSASRDT